MSDKETRDRERDDGDADAGAPMQGGGYGGMQGRGAGHAHDSSGAEIQGASFGHGWDSTPADLAGGGRLPAEHQTGGDTGAGGYTRDDVHIAMRVTDAVAELGAGLMEQVRVRVEQGVVTLTGSVRDLAEMELLQRACSRVQGVKAVRSQLDVAPDGTAPAPIADRGARDEDVGSDADDLGRSADRGSTESGNVQSGNMLGDLPSQPGGA